MNAILQFGLRINEPCKPVESDSALNSAVQFKSRLRMRAESLDFSPTNNRVSGSRVRKPLRRASHLGTNEMRQTIQVRNTRGCNASILNSRYSSAQILATDGFIPEWRLRPSPSYLRVNKALLSHSAIEQVPQDMREEAVTMFERFEIQSQKERG